MTIDHEVQLLERTFEPWPKIARLNRETIITEKIDGTNAAVVISEGDIWAQSRNRLLTPDADNHGFARWVAENADELREQLGEGRHFGEWWGSGIGKRYGAHIEKGEKRFSLFNAIRWSAVDPDEDAYRCVEAPLCHVVPILTSTERFCTGEVEAQVQWLRANGSTACPGAVAEGVVVYHKQGNLSFKVTLEKDAEWKGNDRVA